MKTIQLPAAITIALGRYFINCMRQHEHVGSTVSYSGGKETVTDRYEHRRWDKEADIKNLSAACQKHRYGWEASGGSFWIYKNRKNARVHYYIHIGTWPLAEVKKNSKA